MRRKYLTVIIFKMGVKQPQDMERNKELMIRIG